MKAPIPDHLSPHSLEAEQGVLGCILLSPMDCMGECTELVSCEMFYDLRNKIIYEACLWFLDKGMAFDLIVLFEHLKKSPRQIPLEYLASLPDTVPSAANLKYYVDIVREKFILRNVNKACTQGLTMVREFEDGQSAAELAGKVVGMFIDIADREYRGTPKIRELVQEAISQIESYSENPGKIIGLPTGFSCLDELTWGLHNGELIIFAGRPSTGKTSLAMQMAEFVAVDVRVPVGVFSLEMTALQLVLRMLCSRAKANLRRIRGQGCYDSDFPKLTDSAAKIAGAPIYLDDQSNITLLQLVNRARRMVAQYGIKLLVIDYLQLLTVGKGWGNRQQEIAFISSTLKALAKELGIPVVALSQLNRELDKDKGRKPRLSDLRESGAIEQDADLVGMLYKRLPKEGEKPEEDSEIIEVNLDVSKQRNGPVGYVELLFHKQITRFEQKCKIDPEDAPKPKTNENANDLKTEARPAIKSRFEDD